MQRTLNHSCGTLRPAKRSAIAEIGDRYRWCTRDVLYDNSILLGPPALAGNPEQDEEKYNDSYAYDN
jgi:hypothetical protein